MNSGNRKGAAAKHLPSPLKWHGGKAYLARRIVALMPPHSNYVEPFFGSGAVLFAKDPADTSEVANDLNGQLTNFWQVLQAPELFELFRRRIEATPFSEWEWTHAGELRNLVVDPSFEHAADFFVRCRQSLAGRMDAFAALTKSRLRRGMNEQVSAWLSAVAGLPAAHARLRRVLVLNRPALEVIEDFDNPHTVQYLDPPYLAETRTHTNTYGQYEMSVGDHIKLLECVAGLRSKVLLSGYRNALYEQKLAAWNRHDFELPNNAAGGKKKRRMIECVWTNFDSKE